MQSAPPARHIGVHPKISVVIKRAWLLSIWLVVWSLLPFTLQYFRENRVSGFGGGGVKQLPSLVSVKVKESQSLLSVRKNKSHHWCQWDKITLIVGASGIKYPHY